MNIKFIVSKKGVLAHLPITILYNIISIIMFIISCLDEQKEAKAFIFISIFIIIALNSILFYKYQMLGSSVIMEKNIIKCKFLGRTRRLISYKEINEYGIFWEARIKFIYISRIKLTEFQREEKAFELYKKTKDVIVFQYNHEAMKFLEKKIGSGMKKECKWTSDSIMS